MMTYNEIIVEINNTYDEKRKNREEIAKVENKYNDILRSIDSIKDKVAFRKEHKKEIEENDKKLISLYLKDEDFSLKVKYLKNNAKVAIFNEVMPVALEVLKKYNNKPYGEKTALKIRNEIIEKCGFRFYIHENKYNIYGVNPYSDDVEIRVKYSSDKKALVNNKIQLVSMEDLEICYTSDYVEDINETIKKLREAHKKAREAWEEYKKTCEEYNELTVDGINRISPYNGINRIL